MLISIDLVYPRGKNPNTVDYQPVVDAIRKEVVVNLVDNVLLGEEENDVQQEQV
jgi:hypothetical protein